MIEKWEKEVNIENEQEEVYKYETFAKLSHKIDKKYTYQEKKKGLSIKYKCQFQQTLELPKRT